MRPHLPGWRLCASPLTIFADQDGRTTRLGPAPPRIPIRTGTIDGSSRWRKARAGRVELCVGSSAVVSSTRVSSGHSSPRSPRGGSAACGPHQFVLRICSTTSLTADETRDEPDALDDADDGTGDRAKKQDACDERVALDALDPVFPSG